MPLINLLRRPGFRYLLFVLVAVALYWPILQYDYLDFDDQRYILEDPAIKSLTLENLRAIALETYGGIWYPVTRFTHLVENAMFGVSPRASHGISLLLHVLNALLLISVLVRLGERAAPGQASRDQLHEAAILAGLLWLVHPQHVEVTAWAVQRKELLATLFALLSARAQLERRSQLGMLYLLLALLSKASAVVVPALLCLIELACQDQRLGPVQRIKAALLATRWPLVLGVAWIAVTLLTHTAEQALFYGDVLSLLQHFGLYAGNSLSGLARFLSLQSGLFHSPLGEWMVTGALVPALLTGLGLLLTATLVHASLLGGALARLFSSGLLYYLAALAPVGGLVLFGNYAFGDRYLYLTSVGLYVALFAVILWLFRASRRVVPTAILGGAVLVLAFMLSSREIPRFRDTESIWLGDVRQVPGAVFANQQLGSYYLQRAEYDRAAVHFQAALDSPLEPFRMASRIASALYLAELHCRAGYLERATEPLERMRDLGGDLDILPQMAGALRMTGFEACAGVIETWHREATQEAADQESRRTQFP